MMMTPIEGTHLSGWSVLAGVPVDTLSGLLMTLPRMLQSAPWLAPWAMPW